MDENLKYLDESLSFAERAEDLVNRMTVEEAASQLRYDAPAIPRLGVKSYNWWNEALHGVARCGMATVFPQAIGLAATFDPEAVFDMARAISLEARAKYNAFQREEDYGIFKGLTFWSPNVNIFRDPRWGRGQETYGEDPYLTGLLGEHFVRGLQGDDPRYLQAAGCAKHFAVHSGPEKVRHEFDAKATVKDMEETYLPAFKTLADAGVAGFMGAYNRTNGEPCCASPTLQSILHDRWHWHGYFTSDCWAIADFHMYHHVTSTAPESAALALKNGCQLNCGNTYLNLLVALQEGRVTEEEIRDAAKALMETRMRLGMFDKHTPWDDVTYDAVDQEAHRVLNLAIAEKCLVLLKNDGLLPLQPEKIKTIAVIGPNADNIVALNGNYHGTANQYTTVVEGLRALLPDTKVLYSRGCHLYKEEMESPGYYGDGFSDAVTHAREADVVVLCVGLDETIEGEEMADNGDWTGDKKDLLLPPIQRDLMKAVLATGKPCVIVNMTGSAMDLQEANEQANAVVQAWYPGSRGGEAIARLLLGYSAPSGRLPVTFYHNDDPMPDFTDYSMEGRTYRFLRHEPLYPFGFGLSYTKFAFDGAEADTASDAVTVKATVRNVGEREGEVPVQLYIRHQSEKTRTPNVALAGVRRVRLAAGEAAEVSFVVPRDQLRTVYDDGSAAVESGLYEVFVGESQPDERSHALGAAECAKTSFTL